MNTRGRRGVTLVEVLVIVVVVGIIVSLTVVAIQQARVASRRRHCADNLGKVANGLTRYAREHNTFPFGTFSSNRDLPPEKRLSWYVGIWWEVGVGQGHLSIDPALAWDADENLDPKMEDPLEDEPSLVANPPHLRCPSDYGRKVSCRPGPTTYVGIAGIGVDAAEISAEDATPPPGRQEPEFFEREGPPPWQRAGIFGYNRQTPLGKITDGRTATMLLAETALNIGPWTAGGPPTVRGVELGQEPLAGVGRQFGGLHPGGTNTVFADGSSRYLNDAIDSKVLAAMTTIAGPADEERPSR